MRSRRSLGARRAALVCAAGATLAGCGSVAAPSGGPPAHAAAPPAVTAPPPPRAQACAVSSWPLARRVSQLILVGEDVSDLGAGRLAAAEGVGGFVLFGQAPAGSGPGIRAGIVGLDHAAAAAGQVGPWISTDEEGGDIQRLSAVVGALPAPRTMGADDSPAQIRSLVRATARSLATLGVDVDLAPVADVAPAGDPVADEATRSFSADPAVVSADAVAYADGLAAGGVVAVAKHFPGLGHASADTDDAPATDPAWAQLEADDLLPFRALVEHLVPVVMVGHPVVPGLTGGQPASLAPASYRYLRQQLGFTGVAITDDLDAVAVSAAGYTQATAGVRAVAAGADMVMIDASALPTTRAALEEAVARGAIPVQQLDRAVGLVLTAKGADPCAPVVPSSCGGTGQPRRAAASAADPARPGAYWVVHADGCVVGHGGAPPYGSPEGSLTAPVVAMASTPTGRGYWLATADGHVYAFGAARTYGSGRPGGRATPVTGIAATADGRGYWVV
ncbi:MAG TPA: glycoside hydrolase family 3 N-terminal domain-containing protein, partial [Acidimicrobiales bacterium]|nr:glycoside hydrolase family 3 N-terminal domain-containing protein [Acidimicrobiales bacterium]